MEINGITFEDWAVACGNLAGGMSEEKIISVLGLELPVWQDTHEKFTDYLGEQQGLDMQKIIANPKTYDASQMTSTRYAKLFQNPKQGKFADVQDAVTSDDFLEKVPNIEIYAKIFKHMAIASDHGIDGIALLEKEYNLSIVEWSKVGSHYHQFILEAKNNEEYKIKYSAPYHEALEYWKNHFTELYKENSAGLSDDIDF